MIGQVIANRASIEDLRAAFGRAMRVGAVEVIDPEKGYRLKWAEDADGNPFLSPFYPHPESGGINSSWVPLSKGQVVGVVHPNDDPRQGFLVRGGFSGINPPISDDPDAVVFEFAGTRITVKDGHVDLTTDGSVTVNSPDIRLGGDGGQKVARIGDLVAVGSGSSAGQWPIITGSDAVTAK